MCQMGRSCVAHTGKSALSVGNQTHNVSMFLIASMVWVVEGGVPSPEYGVMFMFLAAVMISLSSNSSVWHCEHFLHKSHTLAVC